MRRGADSNHRVAFLLLTACCSTTLVDLVVSPGGALWALLRLALTLLLVLILVAWAAAVILEDHPHIRH